VNKLQNKTGLIFPHQLFQDHQMLKTCSVIYLIEEFLFFKQFHFHKKKVAFHRASMKFYENWLTEKQITVIYIDSSSPLSDVRNLIDTFPALGIQAIEVINPVDFLLEKRIRHSAEKNNITLNQYGSGMFLLSDPEVHQYFSKPGRFFQTDFYTRQRKLRSVLTIEGNQPLGGKWSFDDENRLKYPKGKKPPVVSMGSRNEWWSEAIEYTEQNFPDYPGNCTVGIFYPVTFEDSASWLNEFIQHRFPEFGPYEDALVVGEPVLHHSVLSPLMNAGLLQPDQIIRKALEAGSQGAVPLNSLEGFIRQVLGWREFIRGVYVSRGVMQRTKNFWKFKRKIPQSFWHGTTGIFPVDTVIRSILDTGYAHHIERLMVLGNFMLLCEFDPDEVYRWFMEMFVDAYDWVMVPNVYGMSQFADGGQMSTKPYLSGSNYLMKMSNYPKGDWQEIWDGLFWNFMDNQRDFFSGNPRLGMLIKTFDKMPEEKRIHHKKVAQQFLDTLN
jgi:deoxyribodipyrimidine photolyase-related protein